MTFFLLDDAVNTFFLGGFMPSARVGADRLLTQVPYIKKYFYAFC